MENVHLVHLHSVQCGNDGVHWQKMPGTVNQQTAVAEAGEVIDFYKVQRPLASSGVDQQLTEGFEAADCPPNGLPGDGCAVFIDDNRILFHQAVHLRPTGTVGGEGFQRDILQQAPVFRVSRVVESVGNEKLSFKGGIQFAAVLDKKTRGGVALDGGGDYVATRFSDDAEAVRMDQVVVLRHRH